MKAIDVIYFVEHKDRELEVAKKVSESLVKEHNLEVVVTSLIFDSATSLFKYKPKVIVTPTPSLSPGSAGSMFYSLYGSSINLISLNYEQFLGSWESASKMIFNEVSKKHQQHLAWGKDFKSILQSNGIAKKNIHITGRPTGSLLRDFQVRNSSEIRNKIFKKFSFESNVELYFFALTDGIAFCTPQVIKSVATRGFSEQNMLDLADYIKETLRIMISWLNKLNGSLASNQYLILRPHPSVSVSEYEKLIEEELGFIPTQLIITKEFNAQEWLILCKKYFTNYSTLLVDSDELNKESFILDPLPQSKHQDNHWWCQGRLRLLEYEDFENALFKPLSDKPYEVEVAEAFNSKTDGISETAKIIAEYADSIASHFPLFYEVLAVIFSENKRPLGSMLRKLLMLSKIKVLQILVKKGIQYDYFTPIHYKKSLSKK